MPLEPGKPVSQSKIPAGTVLFEPGRPIEMLCLVHQGEISIINSSRGNRIMYRIGSNSVPGFSHLLLGEDLPFRVVTSKDSVISAFPVKRDSFISLIMGKLNVGVMAARSLHQEIITSHKVIQQYVQFLSYGQKLIDNISLVYYKANPESIDKYQMGQDSIDPTLPEMKSLIEEFKSSGGEYPNPISHAWLEEDHSRQLKKDYDFESEFNKDEFQFLRKIMGLPMNIQGAVYKADTGILQGLSLRLGRIILGVLQELFQLQHSMDDLLDSLLKGDYSFAEKFFLTADTIDSGVIQISEGEFNETVRYYITGTKKLLNAYQKYMGIAYSDISPSFKRLEDYISGRKEPAKESAEREGASEIGADYEAIRQELSGSVAKIMKFAGMSNEDLKTVTNQLAELRKLENPLDSTPELRKLRRQISQTYWKAYELCFRKNLDSRGNVPTPVRLMLSYGFFDDEFLDREHLVALYNLSDISRPKPEYKIVPAVEWINTVAKKEEAPSIDEMGLSYFEKLKNEFKDRGWKRESEVPEDIDNFDRRCHYEIATFLETNVRLTSGSPATAFPILTKYHITMPLDRSIVSLKKLSDILDQLLSVDYSAFHREILYNDEKAGILKEFIQQQVIPNFILVPSIGTKIMMWQDISGRNKNSTGRIAVPMFATADLYTLVLEAVGAFRWELTKTIQGPDWNNVSVPSITADYTDYVQFFKKNRDLSPEVREKLAAEFKRFRTDRDRFVNDYINWVKFESEGVLKLNKVARSIFYRHIPFAKEIRENIASQPAYDDLNNRLTNIRKKKLRELEVRYRKYGDYNSLPKVIRDNLDFYKV